MKTKIVLFIALVAILSSFTLISNMSVNEQKESKANVEDSNSPVGGLAMEDRDSWK